MPSGPFRRTTGHRPGNARHAREDKDILESTDPDALVDLRRRGVECGMDSGRPGILIRKKAAGVAVEAWRAGKPPGWRSTLKIVAYYVMQTKARGLLFSGIGALAGLHVASCQLIDCKPGTRENSRVLRVTSVA